MAVIICPWCQSEVTQEEGQEPEKFCPICDNELGGYRTMRIDIDRYEDDPDEAEERSEHSEAYEDEEEELDWKRDDDLREKDESLLRFEEAVERLLDEQEFVPECPQCREYMLEAGERIVSAEGFRPRTPEGLGRPLLEAPFAMTVYVCPSCFVVQHTLSEGDRNKLAHKLGESAADSGEPIR
jgi:rubrerythrin